MEARHGLLLCYVGKKWNLVVADLFQRESVFRFDGTNVSMYFKLAHVSRTLTLLKTLHRRFKV